MVVVGRIEIDFEIVFKMQLRTIDVEEATVERHALARESTQIDIAATVATRNVVISFRAVRARPQGERADPDAIAAGMIAARSCRTHIATSWCVGPMTR